MFDDGFFGDLFDFDNDGHLDDLEKSADFAMFMGLVNQENDDEDDDND